MQNVSFKEIKGLAIQILSCKELNGVLRRHSSFQFYFYRISYIYIILTSYRYLR